MSDLSFAEGLCADPAAVLIRRPGGRARGRAGARRRGRRKALLDAIARDGARMTDGQLAALARLAAAIADAGREP